MVMILKRKLKKLNLKSQAIVMKRMVTKILKGNEEILLKIVQRKVRLEKDQEVSVEKVMVKMDQILEWDQLKG